MASPLKGNTYQKYLLDIMVLYKQRTDLRAYLEILLSIIAIGAFTVFAVKPTLSTIGELLTKIKSEEDTAAALDLKIKNLGVAQNLYNNQEAKIKLLQEAVPNSPDVVTYIRQVEGYIKKENLTEVTTSVSPVSLTAATQSGVLTTTFSLTGNYENLENFIKDIENLRRPGLVTRLNYTSIENVLTLIITGNAPYSR